MMDYNLRDGRTYTYFKGKPLYPFGYGLSYTTFEYSNLKANATQLASGGEVSIALDVRNAGARAGDEVVQMYVTHVGSKVPREQEELKGFQRVSLAAGKRTSVRFTLKVLTWRTGTPTEQPGRSSLTGWKCESAVRLLTSSLGRL